MPKEKTLEQVFCERLGHLGLRPGFVKSIDSGSDWEFVIKAHALIEAALNNLLLARFREPLLVNILHHLGTSGEKFSKLAVLKELKIIASAHREFIRNFSRLRNAFAHDVKQFDSNLARYCAEDAKRDQELRSSLLAVLGNPIISGKVKSKEWLIANHLRMAIWTAVLGTANRLIEKAEEIRTETASPGTS